MERNEKRNEFYIDEKDPAKREKLISFLEEGGYDFDDEELRSRQEIIEGILPIMVNMAERIYRMMGNVTCAAGAASSGRVVTTEEFYEYFDQRKK